MRARKSAATLKAAREAFEQRGYHETSMLDIARAADVSTVTLYKHYRSKEHLLAAVLGQAVAAQSGNTQMINKDALVLLNILISEASRIKQILENEHSNGDTISMAEGVVAALQGMAKDLTSE